MNWLTKRLLDDWRAAWKLWSVWFHVASTAIIGILLMVPSMPPEVQALVPAPMRAVAIVVWLAAGYLARVAKQGAPNA